MCRASPGETLHSSLITEYQDSAFVFFGNEHRRASMLSRLSVCNIPKLIEETSAFEQKGRHPQLLHELALDIKQISESMPLRRNSTDVPRLTVQEFAFFL